jgi:hypothetical protein
MANPGLEKPRRGRPPKAGAAKRGSFNTRIRDAVKARLEDAARKAGRSLSEEIESRLERSFDQDRMAEILVAQNSQLFNVLVALAKARGTAGPASKEEIQVFAEFTDRLLQISKDLEVIRAPLGVLRKQKGGG